MKTVGICGAGQMGAEAAVCFRRAGYPVLLWARDPHKLPTVRKTLARLSKQLGSTRGRIELTSDLTLLAPPDGLLPYAVHQVSAITRHLAGTGRSAADVELVLPPIDRALAVDRHADHGQAHDKEDQPSHTPRVNCRVHLRA